MANRALQMEIKRRSRRVALIDFTADPATPEGIEAMEKELTGWLEGDGWDKSLWPQFSGDVRAPGSSKVLKRVRT